MTITYRRLCQALLLLRGFYFLYTCPYSKVEESFALQATHDMFYNGLFRDHFDHLAYPGVVPRTFVGPVALTLFTQLVRMLLWPILDLADQPRLIEYTVRGSLFLVVVAQLFWLTHVVDRQQKQFQNKQRIGNYMLLLTACQFHAPFYWSRLLANTFATIFTIRSLAYWIQSANTENNNNKSMTGAVVDMVVATVVFRCDCLLLLACCGVTWLITKKISLANAVKTGLISVLVLLILTVPLDSFFWKRWVWPEGEVLYFNTVLNKSSDYGVSSWHWYFSSAFPKMLAGALAFVPLSVWNPVELMANLERRFIRKEAVPLLPRLETKYSEYLPYLAPATAFVCLYSFLPHKEVRFLFPVVPFFNFVAAAGLSNVHELATSQKDKRATYMARLAYFLAMFLVFISFIATQVYAGFSAYNYPGGSALSLLEKRLFTTEPIHLYIDVASAQTGVSLFGQRSLQKRVPNLSTTKGGYESENTVSDYSDFDYALTETKLDGFKVIDAAKGFPKLEMEGNPIALDKNGNPQFDFSSLSMNSDAIYVLQRIKD